MHFGKHNDGPVQRWALGSLGLLASLVLVVVSISMNYQFGLTLGRTPQQGLIYAYASAAADIFKVLSPFFIAAAWRARSWTWFGACALIWVITTSYGTVSATGHAALNRADMSGQRVVQADSYKDTRAALKRAQDDLSWIPKHRPADAAQADMEGLKASRLWSLSSECSDPNGKAQRELCQQYFMLKGEVENAKKADLIEARIAEYSKKMDGAQGAAISEADPQASMIAKLTRQDLSTVGVGLVILVILLLEVGSGLGPYVSIAYATGTRRVVTLETEDIAGNLDGKTDSKIALDAPDLSKGAVPTPLKALPAPQIARPEPPSEARELLDAIGFPKTRMKGTLQAKEHPRRSAVRFLAWLHAYNLHGEHTVEAFDRLYSQFCTADHREECGLRVVKPELESFGRFISKVKGPTTWEVKPQPIPRLMALLEKEKVVASQSTAPEPEATKNVLPFSDPAGGEPEAAPSAADPVSQSQLSYGAFMKRIASLKNGLDWQAHDDPSLARQEKRDWQSWVKNRKQKNRMARARSAA